MAVGTTLSLQRRLLTGDCGKWRTLTRMRADKSLDVMGAAAKLARLAEPMEMRIVPADESAQPLMRWTAAAGWVNLQNTR